MISTIFFCNSYFYIILRSEKHLNGHIRYYLLFLFIQDIDECLTRAHRCQADATCINTVGGYNCTCDPGYGGDGFNCIGKEDQYQSFLRYLSYIGIHIAIVLINSHQFSFGWLFQYVYHSKYFSLISRC